MQSQCPGITEQDCEGRGGPVRNLHFADSGFRNEWLTQSTNTLRPFDWCLTLTKREDNEHMRYRFRDVGEGKYQNTVRKHKKARTETQELGLGPNYYKKQHNTSETGC